MLAEFAADGPPRPAGRAELGRGETAEDARKELPPSIPAGGAPAVDGLPVSVIILLVVVVVVPLTRMGERWSACLLWRSGRREDGGKGE